MAYADAFKDIIKARVSGHESLEPEWIRHEQQGNLSWINDLCNRGQGPFKTRESVLCYCMAYMQSHYEAARLVLKPLVADYSPASRVAVLDVGCGPMTAALALADLFSEANKQLIKLNYIGIDTSDMMLKFAKKFSRRSDCFADQEGSYLKFLNAFSEISDRRLSKFLCKATHIVVVFNYILSQSSLTMPQVDELASLLARLKTAADDRPVTVAYANATWPTSWFQYLAHASCKGVGLSLENTTPTPISMPLRQHRLADGVIETVNTPSANNVEYLLTRLRRE